MVFKLMTTFMAAVLVAQQVNSAGDTFLVDCNAGNIQIGVTLDARLTASSIDLNANAILVKNIIDFIRKKAIALRWTKAKIKDLDFYINQFLSTCPNEDAIKASLQVETDAITDIINIFKDTLDCSADSGGGGGPLQILSVVTGLLTSLVATAAALVKGLLGAVLGILGGLAGSLLGINLLDPVTAVIDGLLDTVLGLVDTILNDLLGNLLGGVTCNKKDKSGTLKKQCALINTRLNNIVVKVKVSVTSISGCLNDILKQLKDATDFDAILILIGYSE